MTEDDLIERDDDPKRDPAVLAARLRHTQRLLRRQTTRFTAAIENMPHGFSMFDSRAHLVACNQAYLDLYGLDRSTVRPGVTFRRILEARVAAGTDVGDEPQTYVTERVNLIGTTTPKIKVSRLNSGRVVQVAHLPTEDGGWVSTHQDLTALDATQQQLRHLAYHDPLTGAANRNLFQETLASALEAGAPFALLSLDLDGFKAVNDTLGHSGGDELLCAAVERLAAVAENALVARLGGDEFALFLPGATPDGAMSLAAGILDGFGRPFEVSRGGAMRLGASIGIALSPEHGDGIDRLLAAADRALYAAKRDGKGSARMFAPSLEAADRDRRQLEQDLRQALQLGQFELDYQPVFDLSAQCFSGFEALLRWRHPERGVVSPAEFIPVAEDTGMIEQIGEWVIREAFATAAAWPADYRIAVNVSTEQFRRGNLIGLLVHALAASGLAPSRVEIEITESLLFENHEANLEALRQMHRLGLRVAMDDFGTGYSALSYLLAFPFDKIKIDGSFVRALDSAGAAQAIVHAVADIGKRLGLTVTAEGVETEDQLRAIHALGYQEAQGYLLGRPMSRDAVDRLLGIEAPEPQAGESAGLAEAG